MEIEKLEVVTEGGQFTVVFYLDKKSSVVVPTDDDFSEDNYEEYCAKAA
jgi:hypothetical protein